MRQTIWIAIALAAGMAFAFLFLTLDDSTRKHEKRYEGTTVVRAVGTPLSNEAAVQEFIRDLPEGESVRSIETDLSTIDISYEVNGQERVSWTGADTSEINLESAEFEEGRFVDVIIHHTLALFLTIPDLQELTIRYEDPYTIITYRMDRTTLEEYLPRSIERATSSSRRWNDVVVEGFLFNQEKRADSMERFKDNIVITPR
ncbi:hypothetical protein [Exiguobacterium flavidum]|uniref:hypothetical protein n=1 Tax=Exiguobacterium flavidum TaxID=2184695 RepID=UPI000DF76F7D|nr:hypothetical protein [Exiguobacterium flavidum]